MLKGRKERTYDGPSMAELMGDVDAQLRKFRRGFSPGEAVQCKVVAVGDEFLMLDLNAKMQGVVYRMDLNGDASPPSVGDTLTLFFIGMQDGVGRFTANLSSPSADALSAETKIEALKKALRVGDIREGKVSKIMPFGVFVDLGGMDGLIPNRELSWDREAKAEDILQAGQSVMVAVLEVDWESDHITLSLRSVQRDPWEAFVEDFGIGQYVTGKVTRLMPFGAFVQLAPGVEGLLPISALGDGRRLNHAREALKENETVDVRIEATDSAQRKIALILAATVAKEEAERQAALDASELVRKGNQVADGGALGSLGTFFNNVKIKGT